MSIGQSISQPIPPVSTPGTGYASQLVAFLQEVKSRLEAKVPLSSLLAGLFDLSNNQITNVQSLGLYQQTTPPTAPVGSIQNYQGNLWYVSSGGAAQITAGNSLNAAGIGGIGGDYGGANPASARFVDADQEYYFYDDFGGLAWARMGARSYDIYGGYTSTTRVRLSWAGSTNWTLTLPLAPPASTLLLQMDNTGQVTASNSALDDITLDANKSVSVSGTGKLKHGDVSITQTFCYQVAQGAALGVVTLPPSTIANPGSRQSAGQVVRYPIYGLDQTKRIKSIKIYLGASPGGNVKYDFTVTGFGGFLTYVDIDTITSSAQTVTLTLGTPFEMSFAANSGDVVPYLSVDTTVASVSPYLVQMTITYDSV